MFIWKKDILAELKGVGYNTNRIRKENLLSQSTLQKLRERRGLAWENIDMICKLLNCQPGDIIEYVPEESGGENP